MAIKLTLRTLIALNRGKYAKRIKKIVEPLVINDPQDAYLYAREVLEGRFPLGEPAIARNPNYSLYYARNVLNAPFLAGEEAILKSDWATMAYEDEFGVIEV